MIKTNPSKKEYQQFGLTMTIAVSLFFAFILPWIFKKTVLCEALYFSLVIGVWTLILPNTLFIIYKPWMFIGNIVGFVNTRLILCIVYTAIFIPVSLVMKIAGIDPMTRKIAGDRKATYWQTVKKQPKEHMERIY